MNYLFKQIHNFNNPVPLFFLCGVKYNEKKSYEDKRVVLKKFLEKKGVCSIILEEHFVPGQNNNKKLGYKFIGLKNLNDVETLVSMIVDGIFIIHESHSTAAEIALFASNESVAEKIFVLVPDKENAEEDHFSGFLSFGYSTLIKKPITFYPVTEKYVVNENHIKTYTYFGKNQIGNNLTKQIDKYISRSSKIEKLNVIKGSYQRNMNKSISYFIISNSIICISIDIQLLKYYMIAIFNISEFKKELKKCNKFFEGVSVCEKWFQTMLINTIQNNEVIIIKDLKLDLKISNTINTRLNLRKAISFILYSFHALGWITIEPSNDRGITISKESETSKGFKSIYTKYVDIIQIYKPFDLEDIVL